MTFNIVTCPETGKKYRRYNALAYHVDDCPYCRLGERINEIGKVEKSTPFNITLLLIASICIALFLPQRIFLVYLSVTLIYLISVAFYHIINLQDKVSRGDK